MGVQNVLDGSIFARHEQEIAKLRDEGKNKDQQISSLQSQLIEFHKRANEEQKDAVKHLQEEIKQLTEELESKNKRIAELEKEMASLNQRFRRMENSHERERKLLLLGSVAYNFVDALTEKIFGKKALKSLRKKLRCVEDIRQEANKDKSAQEKWNDIMQDWDEELEDVLEKLSSARVPLAHPIAVDEDSEKCAEPNEIDSVIEDVYKQKDKKEFRQNAKRLVERLDQLKRSLGRDLLD